MIRKIIFKSFKQRVFSTHLSQVSEIFITKIVEIRERSFRIMNLIKK